MQHAAGSADLFKRAYGDWSSPYLQEWIKIFREYSIKPEEQIHYSSGKNSTDSAMIIQAMDFLSQKKADTFILVTSDGDFTSLATRIREEGLRVIGVGRKTAPASFVKSCDEFLLIENIQGPTNVSSTSQDEQKNVPKELVTTAVDVDSSLKSAESLLTKAVENVEDENGLVLGSRLAAMLRRLDPTFEIQNYGAKKLIDFVAMYPNVLKKTDKYSGTDVVYESQITYVYGKQARDDYEELQE